MKDTIELKRSDSKALREELYYTRLPNGLDVYVMPKSEYNEKYAVFATKYGSIDTAFIRPGEKSVTSTPAGVAHFLEHKLFEQRDHNVFEEFAAWGASVNAYTSHAMTSYLFSTTGSFYQCLETLVDFVQNPYFTEANVAKEQGIIAQEIMMYEDSPEFQALSNLLKGLYQDNPVRQKISGTVESVSRITPDILYQCHDTFYHPGNMILFAVGGIEPERTIRLVESRLQERHRPQGAIRRAYPNEPEPVAKSRIETHMSVARPLCYIGFKDVALTRGDELLRRQLTSSLTLQLLFGKASALYNRLYESGLIDNTFSAYYTAEESFAHAVLGGATVSPDKLERAVFTGLCEARENGITEEEFQRQKRKSIGGFLYAFNSLEFIANNFVSTRFRGSSLFSYLDILHSLALSDVERCLQEQFKEERMAVSIVSPRSEAIS